MQWKGAVPGESPQRGRRERGNPPQGRQAESIRKMPIHLCHKQLQTQSDGNNNKPGTQDTEHIRAGL